MVLSMRRSTDANFVRSRLPLPEQPSGKKPAPPSNRLPSSISRGNRRAHPV